MDKIDKIIEKYNNEYITFNFLSELIEVYEILFTETEIKKLEKFYNIEFEKFFNS